MSTEFDEAREALWYTLAAHLDDDAADSITRSIEALIAAAIVEAVR